MNEVKVADRQRLAYKKLIEEVIPQLLKDASYVRNGRYSVEFSMYPVDSINNIEDNGDVYTTIKTFCKISDKETGEQQSLVIDLLNIPVYLELGFMLGGNYKQVLDLYDKPAGWSFSKRVEYAHGNPYNIVSAKLQSSNYKVFEFKSEKDSAYFIFKRGNATQEDNVVKVPISVFFRALTGYSNAELLELFGYDNAYNTMAFSDSSVIIGNREYPYLTTRAQCIDVLSRALFGKMDTAEMHSMDAKLNKIDNWFFKKNYMDLGPGYKKRFDYTQSFRSRALNQILAEEVELFDETLRIGTVLTAPILEKIDNSAIDCIKVNFKDKVYSLQKFVSFNFRALGYYLAEPINCDGVSLKAYTQLDLETLYALNATSLKSIKVAKNRSKNSRIITISRSDGAILTINDLFSAYSIFANNVNGYEFYSDIDELTDKVVVPFDKKAVQLLMINLNGFINKLNSKLDIICDSGKDSKIIEALSDFSGVMDKQALLKALRDVKNTESQLSDLNNVISFVAKDFKVTNKNSGRTTTDSLISVHGLQFGRLDPYDSPESSKIGKVHHRTILAREDEDGYLLAPYMEVKDGKETGNVCYLTATEEADVYVASWDETFVNEDGTPKKQIKARYKGEPAYVGVNDISYKEYSPLQDLSPTTGCIPFLNFAAGKRIQMSCNQQKQAVSTTRVERPRVCTGVESLLDTGAYKASDLLSKYYEEQVYNCPDLAQYKEAVLNSDLQLTQIANGQKVRKLTLLVIALKDVELPGLNNELYLEIPFGQNTLKSDMFSYKINGTNGGYYKNSDVVAYNSSYDTKEYKLSGIMDYGSLKVDNEQLKGSIALGHNYCVAFKTYESSSIDDGIVISSAIVADDTVTSIMIHKEAVELLDTSSRKEVFEAPRNSANGEPVNNFNINGLPKVGTYLFPGDTVVYKKISDSSVRENIKRSHNRYNATKLSPYVSGQVISSKIVKTPNGPVAEVYLASRATGEEADKFAGRIGNKGVVARIVPEEMMPYDPKTGRTIDIILNPLGVPSRMNITQIIEVTLAAATVKKDEIAVVSPFHPDSLQYALDEAKQENIHPIMLVDGRTGKEFERPINVGYQYMYKLVHMAKKNIHAVGLQHGVNSVTLQAKSSSKLNGGQSFGEMESWCLESIGASKVLQELQTTMSDDRQARDYLSTALDNNPYEVHVQGENHNDVMMLTLLRILGADINTKVDKDGVTYYEFLPLKDAAIKALSPTDVTKESLHSTKIFGTNANIAAKFVDREKWGWIDLHTEIIHPIWVEKSRLATLFLCKEVTPSCPRATTYEQLKWSRSDKIANTGLLGDIIQCKKFVFCDEDVLVHLLIISPERYAQLDEENKARFKTGFSAISWVFRHYSVKGALDKLRYKILSRNSEQKQRVLSTQELRAAVRGESLSMGINDTLSDHIDKLFDDSDPSAVYEYLEDHRSSFALLKAQTMMEEFIENGSELTDYLISSYPVMPAIYRSNAEIKGRVTKSDFDVYYEAILHAVDDVKLSNSENLKLNIYNAIKNLVGLSSVKSSKKQYVNALEYFTGKNSDQTSAKNHGKIRETLQKKIIGRSGRSVIIPSQDPERGPMYVGLPFSMAVVMYEEQLIPYLRTFATATDVEGMDLTVKNFRELFVAMSSNNRIKFEKCYVEHFARYYNIEVTKAKKQFIKWITTFIEGSDGKPYGPLGKVLRSQVVLCGRQPSLHRYSIRAYYPKIVFTKAIQVNSLMCTGYNADFDGDQMWVAALLTEEAMDEAINLMSAKADIINAKNGEIILQHSQDIALGIYVLTMLKDNALELTDTKSIYPYSDLTLLKQDVLDGNIHAYDLVSCMVNGKHFVSTAGRIIFNSLIPNAFDAEVGTFTNKLGIDIKHPERFAELLYDGLITSGKSSDGKTSYKLANICKSLYDRHLAGELPVETILDVYQKILSVGFRMSDRYGVSISIFDFREIADKSGKVEVLKDASKLQETIEEDHQAGLLSDDDRVESINTIYKKSFKQIETNIFGDEKAGKLGTISRNNNVFIMFDSGARGSKGQIMQSIGAVGFLQKTKNTNLKLPVLSNYAEGLSSFDFQMLSYSTRSAMAAAQNESQNAGYGTRRSEYCSSGLEILELDCGKKDWWYDVVWADRRDELSRFSPSKGWFDSHLLRRAVDTKDVTTMELFGDTLQNGRITEQSFEKLSKGFNTIKLTDEVLQVTPEMLFCTKILDAESEKYLKYYKKEGCLTREALAIVDKRHLKHVETDIGTFEFRYELSQLSRSLLENREGRNMPGLRKYTGPVHKRLKSDMFIITDETLDWIEREGVDRIEARILLDCETGRNDKSESNKSLHGCCARCYGLKYTTNTLPEIGENIGIEAAQAIGEPAAQLTLSLVNKGGASGESVASGVDILHKLLDGSSLYVDKSKTITYVAKKSGYLEVENIDKKATLSMITPQGEVLNGSEFLGKMSREVKINAKLLNRKNHEWVDAGEAVTDGYVLPNDIICVPEGTQKALLRKKQTTWLYNWFRTFVEDNNIFVNARHFELFTRAQMSDMVVVKSKDPAYKVGKKYKVADVLSAKDVVGALETNKSAETVLSSSGALSALSFEQLTMSLPGLVLNRYKSYKNSPTGALNLGENLVTRAKKQLKPMTVMVDDEDQVEDYVEETTSSFAFVESKKQQQNMLSLDMFDDIMAEPLDSEPIISEKNEVPNEDMESLLDDDVDEITETEEQNDITEEPVISDTNAITLQGMDLFATKCKVCIALLDESYMPVVGLPVALLQNDVIKQNVTSDENGNVFFSDVDAGAYTIQLLTDRVIGDVVKEVQIPNASSVDLGIWKVMLMTEEENESTEEYEAVDIDSSEESEDTGISDYYDEEEDANYDDFNKQYEETRKRKIVTGNGMDFF